MAKEATLPPSGPWVVQLAATEFASAPWGSHASVIRVTTASAAGFRIGPLLARRSGRPLYAAPPDPAQWRPATSSSESRLTRFGDPQRELRCLPRRDRMDQRTGRVV